MSNRPQTGARKTGYHRKVGNIIAPVRFIVFVLILFATSAVAIPVLGWRLGFMMSFDLAALVFLVSCWPLLDNTPAVMRATVRLNDANRVGQLALTGLVTLVILVAIASILMQGGSHDWQFFTLLIITLLLAWAFSNAIYTLHYAHLFYTEQNGGTDRGGLAFPGTKEPNYIDFVYFSFCLGMAFQTSDVEVTDSHMRVVVTLHCIAAFIFNLGVIAFTINVIGS